MKYFDSFIFITAIFIIKCTTAEEETSTNLLLPENLLQSSTSCDNEECSAYTTIQAQPGYNNATSLGYMLPPWLQYFLNEVVYVESPIEISNIVLWAVAAAIDEVSATVGNNNNNNTVNQQQQNGLISPVGGTHSSAGYAFAGSTAAIRPGSKLSQVGPLDTDAESLKVGAGAKLGDIAAYLKNTGYVTSTGVCEDVGISGWILGGGYSPFSKLMGLGCDNVVSFNIVLPNGTYIEDVNESNYPDIFWAVRGAGHQSFGFITSWTMKVVQLKSYIIYYVKELPCEDDPTFCAETLDTWKQLYYNNATWVDSPLSTYSFHFARNLTAPEGLDAPISLTFTFVYADDGPNAIEMLDSIMAPFNEYLNTATPDGKYVQLPYQKVSNMDPILNFDSEGYDSFVDGGNNSYEAKVGLYLKKDMQLNDWQTLVDAALDVRTLLEDGTANGMYFVFEAYSGSIIDKPSDYNAHYQRSETLGDMYFDILSPSNDTEEVDKERYNQSFAWLENLYTGVDGGGALDSILYKSNNVPQFYVNYRNILLGEGTDRWPSLESYYGDNVCRLVDIKNQYDPQSIFDFPQGIPPTSPEGTCINSNDDDLASSNATSDKNETTTTVPPPPVVSSASCYEYLILPILFVVTTIMFTHGKNNL